MSVDEPSAPLDTPEPNDRSIITIVASRSLHTNVKVEARKRGITLSEAGNEALAAWLAAGDNQNRDCSMGKKVVAVSDELAFLEKTIHHKSEYLQLYREKGGDCETLTNIEETIRTIDQRDISEKLSETRDHLEECDDCSDELGREFLGGKHSTADWLRFIITLLLQRESLRLRGTSEQAYHLNNQK